MLKSEPKSITADDSETSCDEGSGSRFLLMPETVDPNPDPHSNCSSVGSVLSRAVVVEELD